MVQMLLIVALVLGAAYLINAFALRARRERRRAERRERHAQIAREWELARSAPSRDG